MGLRLAYLTVDRLEARLKAKGIAVFVRIDHAAGAAAVGMPLRPTELLRQSDGRNATHADRADDWHRPATKALVWEDASGGVWIAYNGPAWLAVRHGLRNDTADAVHAMAGALAKFAEVAAGD
jgi:uncharacterized protein (DUF302 family)